jgi:hypothetical protein
MKYPALITLIGLCGRQRTAAWQIAWGGFAPMVD